jgi:hypothetical protein
MGLRLPRLTDRKSTGYRRLPDKTNNARDSSEDGNEEVRGKRPSAPAAAGGRAAAGQPPQDTYERDTYRPLNQPEKEERLPQRLNEMRRFECFFEKFGLTGRLTKTEIEAGSNCMFLSLTEQLLDLQKLASNTFCPITHADRKVTAMTIRNVAVDYMKSNRAEFEGWLAYPSDREVGDDDLRRKTQDLEKAR